MGWKPVTACELCLAGGTAAQGPAFCQKLRTCRPVDGTVHSASAQKAGIGRVGNGVHSKRCDISLDDGEAGGGRFLSLVLIVFHKFHAPSFLWIFGHYTRIPPSIF